MAKYCKSCGAEYKGEYRDKCGYGKPAERSKAFDKYKSNRQRKEERQAKAAQNAKRADREKQSGRRAGAGHKMSGAQTAVVLALFLGIAALAVWALWNSGAIGSGDKTRPIVDYFTAIAENDYDKYVSTMPKGMARSYDDYIEENGLSKESFVKESYSDYHDILGESFTAETVCGKEEEMGEDEIASAERMLTENFGRVNIKEAYKVAVQVKFSGDRSSQTYNYDVYVARIGFHWYIINIEDYYM